MGAGTRQDQRPWSPSLLAWLPGVCQKVVYGYTLDSWLHMGEDGRRVYET